MEGVDREVCVMKSEEASLLVGGSGVAGGAGKGDWLLDNLF